MRKVDQQRDSDAESYDTIYDTVQRTISSSIYKHHTPVTVFSFVNNTFTPKITTFLLLSVTVTLNRFLVGHNTRKPLLQLHLQSKAEFQACLIYTHKKEQIQWI